VRRSRRDAAATLRAGNGDMDMGSVLITYTEASWWSYMALVCRVGHVTGGATDNHFPFSYSESGVSSLNFHLDRERT
jgi:hypothetical protein